MSNKVKLMAPEEIDQAERVLSMMDAGTLDETISPLAFAGVRRLIATVRAEQEDAEECAERAARAEKDTRRLDWLERQNAIVRGDSPILPPSCGLSVRRYIDQCITDEATPRAVSA